MNSYSIKIPVTGVDLNIFKTDLSAIAADAVVSTFGKYIIIKTIENLTDEQIQTVLDSHDTAGIPNDLQAYKLSKCVYVDNQVGAKFFGQLTQSGASIFAVLYVFVAHMFKGFEAMDIMDDDEIPTVESWPKSYRPKPGGGKEHRVMDKEKIRRGVTDVQMAGVIKPLSNSQIDWIGDLEDFRAPIKDSIAAVVIDATNGPHHNIVEAVAAVDAIILDFDDNLLPNANMVIPS